MLAGASLLAAGKAMAGNETAGKDEGSPGSGNDTGKPFNLNYGIHDGLFRNNAGPGFYRSDQICL